MHRVTCSCGRECAGKTRTEAENVRAACHGDRVYRYTARQQPLRHAPDADKPIPPTATRRPA